MLGSFAMAARASTKQCGLDYPGGRFSRYAYQGGLHPSRRSCQATRNTGLQHALPKGFYAPNPINSLF